MPQRGGHTLHEITAQTSAWTTALEVFAHRKAELEAAWNAINPHQIIVTGCGSTYYLSLTAAWLLQSLTGVPARGIPASELVFFPDQCLTDPENTLLIAISRSGTTSETAAALTKFRRSDGAGVWGITCYPDTPVGQESDLVLLAEAAQEQSIAQTRSFSTMLLLAQALAATAAGIDCAPLDQLPAAGQIVLDTTAKSAEYFGTSHDLANFFFLGSGAHYGIACEAMLKMKEMSISHSEAYHFMEFRHGPKALVDKQTLVTGLFGTRAFDHERAVLDEMAKMGAQTLVISPFHQPAAGMQGFNLPADLPPWALPVLYLPALQLMAYHRAIYKGLDPDRPRNLDAVVVLDRENLLAAHPR